MQADSVEAKLVCYDPVEAKLDCYDPQAKSEQLCVVSQVW